MQFTQFGVAAHIRRVTVGRVYAEIGKSPHPLDECRVARHHQSTFANSQSLGRVHAECKHNTLARLLIAKRARRVH